MTHGRPFIKIGYVFSITDETDGQRIKVRLNPDDIRKSDSEIPYAYPLLPKHVNIKPKIGEAVLVLCTKEDDSGSRYYVGPIISQPQFLSKDSFETSALSLYPGATIPPTDAPSTNSESHGAFAKDDDICLYGRNKSDVIMTDDSVRIRCGSRLKARNKKGGIIHNESDPAYIHLRHTDNKRGKSEEDAYRSTATIVADEINLISHKSNDKFRVTDKKHLIDDDKMQEIIDKAHQLPYGDTLVDFLNLFLTAFKEHTHDYPGNKPDESDDFKKVTNYDLNQILSKHVRIN